MRWLTVVAAIALTALAVSAVQLDVERARPKRLMRPKLLKATSRFKPVVVPKGDPRARGGVAPAAAAAPVVAPAAAVPAAVPASAAPVPVPVPAVPTNTMERNLVIPNLPSTEPPQVPASPTAFLPAAPAPIAVPDGAIPKAVADKATAAAQVGPTRVPIYAATFMTADGMPIISNDPKAVASDALVRRDRLEALAVPNPSVVTVLTQPPIGAPIVAPGTGPLNPKQSGAQNAADNANAGAASLVPKATRVLKLGATAGDNACVRQGGQCQESSTCGGVVTRLLCPGPPSITCCTYTTKECAAVGGVCRDLGSCLGDMRPGLCGTESSLGCCTAAANWQGPLLPNIAGNCLLNFNAQAFATRARKFLREYTDESADAVKANEIAKALGYETKVTSKDPASLVTSVLDTLGWGCRFNADTGKSITSIIEVVKSHGGFHPFPKVGDVALWADHSGIVVELCVGGRLDIVTMSPPAVNAPPQTNMRSTGCTPLQQLAKAFPASLFLGFWTPQ